MHFDRLKPCHQNIRIPAKTNAPQQQANTDGSPLHSRTPPPPGTMLQLVEDNDDRETQREMNLPSLPISQEQRRYPLRSRRRPVRYGED